MHFDAIVAGTGFSGSVIARKLADNLDANILVLEKRAHIAGNMYDQVNEQGVRVQMYGPHTVITDKEWVIDFIGKYSEWESNDVTAKVEIDNSLYTLPFNYSFIREYYSSEFADLLIQKLERCFGGRERVTIFEILDCPDEDIQSFGEMLCQKDYFPYSSKQWGIPMDKMDRSVISRVKFALSDDNRYIQQRYQYTPVKGYTDFFEHMLDTERITVRKNTDALRYMEFDEANKRVLFNWNGEKLLCPIIFTGPIDELFSSRFGALPYRTLDIQFKTLSMDSYQDVPFISYPQAAGYTRIVEYKKLTNQTVPGATTISIEYPESYVPGTNEPYYPIINEPNLELYRQYRDLADEYCNLFVCGRLGDYKYYNMDAAIERALQVEEDIEKYILDQQRRV